MDAKGNAYVILTTAAERTSPTTRKLSVTVEDNPDEEFWTYTWRVLSRPDGAPDPTFTTEQGTNGAEARRAQRAK